MNKHSTKYLFIFIIIYFIHITAALAQVPVAGTVKFDYQGNYQLVYGYNGYSCAVTTGTQDMGLGYEFVTQGTTGSGGGPSLYVSSYQFAANDGMISFDRSSTAISVLSAYIMSAASSAVTTNSATSLPVAGGEFKLTSIDLMAVAGTPTVTIQAYRDNVAIGSAVSVAITSTTKTTVNLSANANFANIDEIKLAGFSTAGIRVDNITSVAAIVPVATPTITVSGNPGCGAGSVTLTASGGSPAGGTYSWYNFGSTLTPDPVIATGTTFSPIVTGSYYVIYTQGATTSPASSNASVTINPVVSSPTPNAVFSYSFTGNSKDVSGNQNDGLLQNTPTLTTDRYGAANSAYNFNGTNQFVETTSPNGNPQTFTISLWFNTTTTTGGRLAGFSQYQTGGGSFDRHVYMNNAGQIYFGVYSGATNTVNTASSYNDGIWHHVVATLSSTSGMKLYVDNVLQASNAAFTSAETQTNGYWEIGGNNMNGWPSSPTSAYFKGVIDDVSVFNTDLSSSTTSYTDDNITQIGAYAPVCAGTPITIYSPLITGATYSWTDPNGVTATGQNPTFASAAVGNYTLTVTGGPGGCTSTATITPTVYPATAATFTATSAVDVGANATITLTSTYNAALTYAWNFGGGTPSTGSGAGPFSVQWATAGNKTITLTVSNAAGCSSVITQTVSVNSTSYSTYAYRMPITLSTSTLGISTDQTNFPFLVSITDPSLVVSTTSCSNKVQYPTGPFYDFAFVDAVAGEIPYQVESYDQTAGTLLVWVKLPTLNHSTNNTLSFYFGSATAPATHTAAFYQSTWASDYQAVYHFNESTYTGSVVDGTANVHTGTTSGMSATDLVASKIGKGYTFNGSGKKISVAAITVTSTFTLSAWVNLSGSNVDQKIMTNQSSAGTSSGGYKLGLYNNIPETESPTSNKGSSPPPTAFATGAWHYVQGVYNGSTVSTYVDGVQYEITSGAVSPTSTSTYYIGAGEGGTQFYFNGLIDEARVSNVAKSSDWLLAEYKNQNNPSTFTTSGLITTNLTNAELIYGGVTFTTTNGTAFTYTSNGAAVAATPTDNGKENFVIAGAAIMPVAATIYGITINNSSQVDLNGQTLNVGCNIVNNGVITNTSTSQATLVFNGSQASQTYTGVNTVNTAKIGNMTINNSAGGTVTLKGGPVDIYNQLTLTKGNLVVDNVNSGVLTLKSTSALTASVGIIPAAYSITGTVRVERFITGGAGYRGYRLLSSPVIVGTDGSGNKIYGLDYIFNTTYVSGTGFSVSTYSKTGNPSFYLYRENLAPLYTSFLNSNNRGIKSISASPAYTIDVDGGPFNIPVGNGFLYFFRGGTSTLNPFTSASIPVATTLAASGTLTQGNVQVVDWYTPGSTTLGYTVIAGAPGTPAGNSAVRGFNLVGNPYASSIDWSGFYNSNAALITIPSTNVNPTIWELKSGTNTYGTYNAQTGLKTNGGDNIIGSGEGFFIQTNNLLPVPATLKFTENAKSTSQRIGPGALNSAYDGKRPYSQYLVMNVAKDTTSKSEIVVGFNPGSAKSYNQLEDDRYLSGQAPQSMWITTNDSVKVVAKWLTLPKAKQTDTANLTVTTLTSGQYTLTRSELKAVPDLYNIWLLDKYKKDSLDLKHNDKYVFDINLGDTASYGSNRFKILIRQDPALGLHLLDFTATKGTDGAQIAWKTENEEDYTNFTVERSTDNGITFDITGGFVSDGSGTYGLVDKNPLNNSVNWYRLKLEDQDGTISYSKAIPLIYGNANISSNNVSVYPNPAIGTINLAIVPGLGVNLLSVQSTTSTTGQSLETANNVFGIKIVNSSGSVVKTTTTTQPTWQTDVSSLMPGTYFIQVVNNKDKSIIGKTKFVKL